MRSSTLLATLLTADFHDKRSRVPITPRSTRPGPPSKPPASLRPDAQRDAKPIQRPCALNPEYWSGSRPGAQPTRHRSGGGGLRRAHHHDRGSERRDREGGASRRGDRARHRGRPGRQASGVLIHVGSPRCRHLAVSHHRRARPPHADGRSTSIPPACGGRRLELSRRRSPVRIRLGVSLTNALQTDRSVRCAAPAIRPPVRVRGRFRPFRGCDRMAERLHRTRGASLQAVRGSPP